MKLLFLCARFPWPLLRGDQARAYQQLRLLAPRHRVTLVCYGERNEADEARLSALCERVVTVPLGKAAMGASLARGAFSELPFQVSLYRHGRLGRTVRALVDEGGFDLLHVQLARMAPHAQGLRLPRFIDFVDALSLSTRRRSAQHGPGPLRWLTALEARRLLAYERRLCAEFDGACVVSEVDRTAIGAGDRLEVVPNGVDLERFRCGTQEREPATVLFTGNMGYFPNVNAVRWFVERVWPLVRRREPGARFDVVGARPTAAVRRLDGREGVRVLGFVEDVREHLRGATVCVAPMQAGAGQQFKVLEAMASGAPVVATPLAAAGLDARHGRELLVAESPEEFAAAVAVLLSDRLEAGRLAGAARAFVEAKHSWEGSTARLEALHAAARSRRGL